MGVQMFVCLSLGIWRANGNPNPCIDLDEILHAHSYLSKEGFDAGLTTSPSHPWAWGPETLKPEGQRFSAGCILIRAVPGTSASLSIFFD